MARVGAFEEIEVDGAGGLLKLDFTDQRIEFLQPPADRFGVLLHIGVLGRLGAGFDGQLVLPVILKVEVILGTLGAEPAPLDGLGISGGGLFHLLPQPTHCRVIGKIVRLQVSQLALKLRESGAKHLFIVGRNDRVLVEGGGAAQKAGIAGGHPRGFVGVALGAQRFAVGGGAHLRDRHQLAKHEVVFAVVRKHAILLLQRRHLCGKLAQVGFEFSSFSAEKASSRLSTFDCLGSV